MKRQWTCVLVAAACCGLCAWRIGNFTARADEVVEASGDDEVTQSDSDITSFMHAKMLHSQRVLHGVITQDFEQIERGADGLRATSLLSPGPHSHDALDSELYEHFRLEFLRLSTKLGEMARDRNLEGAAFTYNCLTANCMACHQYLKEQDPQVTRRDDDDSAKQ